MNGNKPHLSTNDYSNHPKAECQLSIKLKREFKQFSKTLNSLSFLIQQQKYSKEELEDKPSFYFDGRDSKSLPVTLQDS